MIPKFNGVDELKDFRLFSLMGSFHKLLAKTLARRLEMVLDDVLLQSHNAFVERRQILDCSLIANECTDLWNHEKVGVVCMLDMGKAYDHVSWVFLDHMMRKMGFRQKWRKWIQVHISTVSFFYALKWEVRRLLHG